MADTAKHIRISGDLKKFVEMYRGFGIVCKVNPEIKEEQLVGYSVTMAARVSGMNSDPRDTTSEKIDGYGGFYVRHLFDQNGKFKELGIWE